MARADCPPDDELWRMLNGSSIDENAEIARHLTECGRCRRLVEGRWNDEEVERWREILAWAAAPDGSRSTLPDGMIPENAATPLPEIEGFEVLEEIGRGGTGIVYRARQSGLNRYVALKLLSSHVPSLDRAVARMRQESVVIARLRHPNIVTIHEIGWHGDLPYLCLELLEGGSLGRKLAGRPVSAIDAARLMATIARTIQAIHDAGIVHRDLKPANILLAGEPDSPLDGCTPKVSDFGLSKYLADESPFIRTRTGEVLGTPCYMAPEQLSGGRVAVGRAADIYALGAILFELLTGRPPYLGETAIETAVQTVVQPPPRPRSLNPSIPPRLESICLKCLSKKPSRRHASAELLARDLDAFVLSTSHAVSRLIQSSWASRGNLVTAGIAIVVIGVVIGGLSILGSPEDTPKSPTRDGTAHLSAKISAPIPRITPVGQEYLAEARVEIIGAEPTSTSTITTYAFDLQDRNLQTQERFLDRSLTRNAKIWYEPRYEIRYWGPIDDRDWFEVTYRFPFEFAIESARLHASIDSLEDSLYCLEATTDPSRGWTRIRCNDHQPPDAGNSVLDDLARGQRCIYVRARMKGRDDGAQSSLAQFLRTSTSVHEHTLLKGTNVFRIVASDRHLPRVVCQFETDESEGWRPVEVGSDGSVRLSMRWAKTGLKILRLRASVDGGEWSVEKSRVLVADPGITTSIAPYLAEIDHGNMYHAQGRIIEPGNGDGVWTGRADYGDGTPEEPLVMTGNRTFKLSHRYDKPGRHVVFSRFQSRQGLTTGNAAVCQVR